MRRLKMIVSGILALTIVVMGIQTETSAATKLSGGVIQNGTTLIPMRSLFEALGAEIKWDNKEKSVTAKKGETTIKLFVNSNKAVVNGESLKLETSAKIINSTTMVPVRFVSESLGSDVKWDSKARIVTVNSGDQVIEISVEDPKLSLATINETIRKAEKVLGDVTMADGKKYANGTLTNQARSQSKEKVKSYYTNNFMNNRWSSIYGNFETGIWYTPMSDSVIKDSYIKQQTSNKVVVYYLLENEMEGERLVEYRLVKNNNKWFIDEFNFYITIEQAKFSVELELFDYGNAHKSIIFAYDNEVETIEEMARVNSYTIHVFQDAPDFVRTIGFYSVNKRTGEVTSLN